MKKKIILLFITVILIAGMRPLNANAAEQTQNISDEPFFQDTQAVEFGLISQDRLWLKFEGRLYLTIDNGLSWDDITPPTRLENPVLSVDFVSPELGFTLYLSQTETTRSIELLKTTDGGKSWVLQTNILENLISNRFPTPIASLKMEWLNQEVGFILAKEATGINFSQGALFVTHSSGSKWEMHEVPAAEYLQVIDQNTLLLSNPFDSNRGYQSIDGGESWVDYPHQTETSTQSGNASLVDVQTLDGRQIWAGLPGGQCDTTALESGETLLDCKTSWVLQYSQDSGTSWTDLGLPNGENQFEQSFKFTTTSITQPEEGLSSDPENTTWIQVFKGHAFDACEIPTLAQMQTWFTASPFRAVNIYVGGISRSCKNTALTAEYLRNLHRQGWLFIPTWVGPQAPCTSFKNKFSFDVDEAYQQGVDNANQAMEVLRNLNLTNENGSGSIVYYDLEYFTYSTSCSAAARSFVNGWTTRLYQLGIWSGLYATSFNITSNQFWTLPRAPLAVWVAEWYNTPGFRPDETVWDLRHLSNDYWTNNKRILQYSGTFSGTWGEVTLSIDPDVSEGPLSVPSGVDYIPPLTSITVEGTLGYLDWYKTNVKFSLTSKDFYTGVKQIYYKVGNGAWTPYSAPVTVNDNGLVNIYYRSVDNAGNWETVRTKTVKIDTLPPAHPTLVLPGCRAFSGLPQPWCNNARFTWNASVDAGVGLSPTDTYQYYWGANCSGTATTTTTERLFDPPAIPAKTPYCLRMRVQDRHGVWSAWKTVYILHYDPSIVDVFWMPLLFQR